jgi:response regulator RpfG family c-di-GMP phosphodiesterase
VASKILLVDDEANALEGYRRALRKRFDLETAPGGAVALELLRNRGPFAVVVSDQRMPEMTGVELLTRIHTLSPETVRVMLTGYADLDAAMAAVNQGHVFRFLAKPCPTETLIAAIDAALEQHNLIIAERELLDKTLRGSIQALTEILTMANPEAFSRSARLQRLVRRLIQAANPPDGWRIDLAAALSQIGCISIPKEITQKMLRGDKITDEEEKTLSSAPALSAHHISRIPRLEEVAEIIRRQNDRFDANPTPPLGSCMLKLASDYDLLVFRGMKKFDALDALKAHLGSYNLDMLKLLEQVVYRESGFVRRAIPVADLAKDMIVDEDILTESGLLLLAKGQEINATCLVHLENYARSYGNRSCGVTGSVPVLIPTTGEDSST